jgi:hypothetical protein
MTDSDIRTLKQLSDQEREAWDRYCRASFSTYDQMRAEWAGRAMHLAVELAVILAKDPNGIRHVYAESMREAAESMRAPREAS